MCMCTPTIRSMICNNCHTVFAALQAQKEQLDRLKQLTMAFCTDDLELVADSLDMYAEKINVGNVTGEGDTIIESTPEYAARFIRAVHDVLVKK